MKEREPNRNPALCVDCANGECYDKQVREGTRIATIVLMSAFGCPDYEPKQVDEYESKSE